MISTMRSSRFIIQCPPALRQQAFTIVTVLIILTLLAVIAVGFLSSMTAERTTSVAFANKAKADQAAQAGVDNAMATSASVLQEFPGLVHSLGSESEL